MPKCQRNAISPVRCARKAAVKRDTGKVVIRLCSQCDASIGNIVGEVVA